MAQDRTLSLFRHGFESRWGHNVMGGCVIDASTSVRLTSSLEGEKVGSIPT